MQPEPDPFRFPAFECRALRQFGIIILFFLLWSIPAHPDARTFSISEKAAERCEQKFSDIRDFNPQVATRALRSTRITEEEINSYLALNSNSKYQSCLGTLKMTLKQDTLEGLASVDFDCLKKISLKSIPRYILLLLDGTHVISGSGKIISNNGEGTLYLEKALLDGSRLPNFLIEEAVEAVCKSQKLSFNPLQPTLLPYSIKKVTVHPGYIMVYQ